MAADPVAADPVAADPVAAAPEAVPDDVLEDLRRRLRAYRPVPLPEVAGWERGADPGYVAELVEHWATRYDWRVHEARVRALPWVLTGGPGTPLRSVHQRAADPAAPAVVLLHGWPDSVLRFERLLPLLDDVHVVAPALPGYPFAAPVAARGASAREMAAVVAAAVAELGHERFVVSGGDIGSFVAEELAQLVPERVAALHLTDVPQSHFLTDLPDDLSAVERDYVERGRRWREAESGYAHEQSTKPATLAVALGDSPAGVLAWVVEKLRSWTDCGGDVEAVFDRDALLTWVTAYWVSASIGTSFTPYATTGAPPRERLRPPAVFSVFPRDLVNAPEEFARRTFDVRGWHEEATGGHFASWEEPERYAAGLRHAVRVAG